MVVPVYHITHVDNLPRIIETNGLWCDAERISQNFDSVSIAHADLKSRRASHPVPVAAKGTLADYVPFYFANRSPMLFSIHRGFVTGYNGGQAQIVHLVSAVDRIVQGERAWCFTDGHAVMGLSSYYDDLSELDKVDWNLIRSWSWKDTDRDPDRKRRKQAEFLVHRSFPWNWVERIAVIDQAMKRKVERIIQAASYRPSVVIEPKWYY